MTDWPTAEEIAETRKRVVMLREWTRAGYHDSVYAESAKLGAGVECFLAPAAWAVATRPKLEALLRGWRDTATKLRTGRSQVDRHLADLIDEHICEVRAFAGLTPEAQLDAVEDDLDKKEPPRG